MDFSYRLVRLDSISTGSKVCTEKKTRVCLRSKTYDGWFNIRGDRYLRISEVIAVGFVIEHLISLLKSIIFVDMYCICFGSV